MNVFRIPVLALFLGARASMQAISPVNPSSVSDFDPPAPGESSKA
jgi:hypothetical protein